jgi:hypothetical protein
MMASDVLSLDLDGFYNLEFMNKELSLKICIKIKIVEENLSSLSLRRLCYQIG